MLQTCDLMLHDFVQSHPNITNPKHQSHCHNTNRAGPRPIAKCSPHPLQTQKCIGIAKEIFSIFLHKNKKLGFFFLYNYFSKKKTHIILFILHYNSKILFCYQVFYFFLSLRIKILKNKFVYKVINSNGVYLQGNYNQNLILPSYA